MCFKKGWRFLTGAKHLGTNHECGTVSGFVSGFMPEIEPGTSHPACSGHYLLCHPCSWWETFLAWETFLYTTEKNSWCGHVPNRCFVVGLLERGHHTYIFWGWTGVTLLWARGNKTPSLLCSAYWYPQVAARQEGRNHNQQKTLPSLSVKVRKNWTYSRSFPGHRGAS